MKLLDQYEEAKAKLAYWKKQENELRIKVVDRLFPNCSEGTEHAYRDGKKIKAVFRMNYKIDQKMFDEDNHLLTDYELECVRTKYELSLTKFKQMDPEEIPTLLDMVTITPGLPSISIELDDEAAFRQWNEEHTG